MKKLLLSLLIIVGAVSTMLIYSCKKSDNTTSTSTTPGSSLDANDGTSSDDANYYKSENDQVNSDVNTDLSNYSIMQAPMRLAEGSGSFQSVYPHPCGCDGIDTTNLHSTIPTIIYHFDGTSHCYGRIRSGAITVQLTNGKHWSDTSAVLTFSTTNYNVRRLYDNKTITFSGTKTLKNVNGSSLLQLYYFTQGTQTLKLQERTIGMKVTFNSGLQATWNTANTTTWAYDTTTKIIAYTANGDTTVNSYSNVISWGTDRFGNAFYTHLVSPLICNSNCGYWQPMSGQFVYNVDTSALTLTLGVNQDGSLYTGLSCPWGYKVAWLLGNGNNGTANLQYW